VQDIHPIAPVRHSLVDKRVRVPASKSVANRELVLSAIAHGRSRLELGPLDPGADVRAMATALADMGYQVSWDGATITVTGAGDTQPTKDAVVNAQEAGTVARFGTAVAALGARDVLIDGAPRMRARPIASLVAALRKLGAKIDVEALLHVGDSLITNEWFHSFGHDRRDDEESRTGSENCATAPD